MSEGAWSDCGSGVRLESGVRCRLSDGVELLSDHYHPAAPGPQPTLLMRQPYGRAIASTVVYAHPVWFARHGYNVVIQDVRGRGDSGGEFYPFRHEARDGAETIAWLRARTECDGQIGMYGFSYQGATQLLAAAEQPEGLVCIAPAMTACDLYHGWFYEHGVLRLASTLGWGLQMLKGDARRLRLRACSDRLEAAWANLPAQASTLPLDEHPALQGEGLPKYVLDWLEHAEPGEYWSAQDVSKSLERICVPALHLSGWYDTFLRGSVEGFLALCERAGTAFARERQYLIAGPWQHIPWGDRVGPGDFGNQALMDTDALLLRWFNHWLKKSGEFAKEPRVRYFALGEHRWHAADSLRATEHRFLYLHSSGRANSRKGDGLLNDAAPAGDEPGDIFVQDPEVPVAAPGGSAATAGPFDQAALELGNNMLVYTSEPLKQALPVVGFPNVTLYAATSAGHADFTAKLVRVRADGMAEFICMGAARASWLFGENSYEAGKVNIWQFALEPTACLFAVGEAIRLEIASSAFPLFDKNPGSGVPASRATSWDWKRSTQSVFHDQQRPSLLRLPVREAQA
jgi:putative CocE/NonD family hydrolase